MTATPPPDPARVKTPTPPPLAPVHDFAAKLRQKAFRGRVEDYVAWRRAVLAARRDGLAAPAAPPWAPLSINLDLTTACNFACDHCIDLEALNTGIGHDDARLRDALALMTSRGLRSVILIGGGEPTVYPRFREMVRFLKELELDVAVVSNGSRNDRLLDVCESLGERDWVRLSLDAGTDATFQAMHKPKTRVTLEEICAWMPRIKARNPAPRLGFSFVITWQGAEGEAGTPLVENVGEIVAAARMARDHAFDYISFKPFLLRTAEGAEVMDPSQASRPDAVITRIRAALDEAHTLATDTFDVVESTNLKLLETGSWAAWTRQPRTCHMQALRQVVSPLGLWNCPAHRGVAKARIAARDAFVDESAADETADAVAGILDSFDAAAECREVTCLYNHANWWIEGLIDGDMPPQVKEHPGEDTFL